MAADFRPMKEFVKYKPVMKIAHHSDYSVLFLGRTTVRHTQKGILASLNKIAKHFLTKFSKLDLVQSSKYDFMTNHTCILNLPNLKTDKKLFLFSSH